MSKDKVFYICSVCKNLVEMIDNKGPRVFCCGQKMDELAPNTQEAATEKHIPVIKIEDDTVKVEVGSTLHPMTEDHYIGWIYLLTSNGVKRKDLQVNEEPIAQFKLIDDEKVIEAYAYCNLHGLWKIEI